MHRVLIHAVFETIIAKQTDDSDAQSIAERLFEDEVTSKAEMFSVSVERVEVQRVNKPVAD